MSNNIPALEKALNEGDEALEAYLGDVSIFQFKIDIKELMKAYSDKQAIKSAIDHLKKLL